VALFYSPHEGIYVSSHVRQQVAVEGSLPEVGAVNLADDLDRVLVPLHVGLLFLRVNEPAVGARARSFWALARNHRGGDGRVLQLLAVVFAALSAQHGFRVVVNVNVVVAVVVVLVIDVVGGKGRLRPS